MNFPFSVRNRTLFDVVGFGTNAVDHLIYVPEYPRFNSKIKLNDHLRQAGGEVASTLVGLQRLAQKTAYCGRFGSDLEGEEGLRSLSDEGVNIEFAEVVTGARTQIAFIIIDKKTGERTIIWDRDERLQFTKEDAPLAAASLGRVLHLTPHDTAACIEMAKVARAAGVIVSIDIDNVFPGVDELLPLVDILIASVDFGEKLLNVSDPKAALSKISLQFGCGVVGFTLGASGSRFYCQNTYLETPGFTVPGGCVDTTGAGDAFRTGFLYGVLTGETVEESARLANAVAALKCRKPGARAGLPAREELTRFLADS